MNSVVGKLAPFLVGLLVAAVVLNLGYFLGSLVLEPLAMRWGLKSQRLLGPFFWVCLGGGVVTGLFAMLQVRYSIAKGAKKEVGHSDPPSSH
ncbi:hypothetical protein NA78x_003228 [Anatilimnocola sp. NA78]|uniref:hypothetical protein n=1 Tax=Anatilimnocola sp. NA78 TaxID=3415683 RepID=UPI003CE4E4E2